MWRTGEEHTNCLNFLSDDSLANASRMTVPSDRIHGDFRNLSVVRFVNLFIPTARIFGRKDGTKHSSIKKYLHNYRIVIHTVLEYLGIKIAGNASIKQYLSTDCRTIHMLETTLDP